MAEYIEREAAIKSIRESDCRDTSYRKVKKLPAANVRPVVRGKWEHITLGYDNIPFVKCNQCGLVEPWDEYEGMEFALHNQMYANFCPNCGADMRRAECG